MSDEKADGSPLTEINAVNINGQRVQGPITSVSFNPAVNLFALAFSYDVCSCPFFCYSLVCRSNASFSKPTKWSEGWVSNLESKPIVVAFVSLKVRLPTRAIQGLSHEADRLSILLSKVCRHRSQEKVEGYVRVHIEAYIGQGHCARMSRIGTAKRST